MRRHWSHRSRSGLTTAAGLVVAALSTAFVPCSHAQVVDTQLPLNYNFHGMARGDEAITNASPINADFIQYRSIADRGLYFDQNDPHSIGGTPLVGQTGVTYSLYNTLGYVNTTSINPGDAAAFGLDCVHLGIRGQYNRLYDTDSTTNAGPFPGWAPDVATNTNHTGDQVTVLSTPVTVDAATEIGVLYMATDSGGQFDVVLTFNNGIADTNVSVRVAAPDWFGIPADPAIVAGQPVISQKKIVHNVNGTNFSSFTGVSGADSARLENFVVGGGGPNLNVTEAVIGVAQIIAQGNNVAGQQLTKITFRNAAYPTKAMSALTGDGTTATATFSANHGFLPGTSIVVAGANVAGLNGSYTIANLGGQKAVATLGVTTGTTVSATTAVPHGFAVGNNITIMGATPASFNGSYAITSVPNTTTFNFTNANAVGTASGSIEVGNARIIQYANATTAASTTGTRTALGLGVGRGYAVYAATVRSGSPTRINCNTPDQIFSGDNQSDNKRTFGATPSGFGSNDTSAAWYAYTANNTGPVEVRTCGASFDTTLAVYGSCVGSAIAGNDNGCGNASRLTWNATAGNTYLIRVAGNNGATGLYNVHIDDPAHADITMPLQFNWNGICHGPSEQTLPGTGTTPPIGSIHENRSDLNGYRSIADRGLLCDGVQTNALNFGGTTGFEGILYNIYATPLQADMIHLGDRSLAAGGGRNWSPPGTNWPSGGGTSTSNNGLRPIWLNQDSQPSSTSSMTSLNAVFGPNTKVAFLYHMANGGTSFGSIDVRLDFTDSSSVTATVDATDWFETNTTVMPAARAGVELQRKMGGPWRAVQNTDKADDAGAAAGRLWVNEAVLSTSSLQALGFDANGKTLAAITFENVRSAPNGAGNAVESAFGVFAATLRDPASFNLNFGPGGTGTVTPNQLVASAAGKITVNVSRGSGSPNNITSVLVDASSVGLSSTFALNDSGIGGDTTPNDNIWSANIAFPVNASSGAFSLPFTVNDAQARTASGNIIFSLVTPNAIVSPTPILAGNSGLVTVALGLDTGANTDINTVSLDGSPLGLGAIALNDSGTGGDATPNDGVWSASLPIPGNALGGVYPCGYTVMDLAGRSFSGSLNVSVVGPPIATDLGTLTNGFTTSSTSISPGEVKWFKFTLSAPVESALLNYLDIDTEGSSTTGGNLAGDTYIGVYDANGNRISSDDDDGSANFSAISYGATNPPRPPFGNGLAYNGRDGALPAGTYYIGVSGFNATFNATEWSVTTTHTHTGTVNINLALGTVPAGGPPATFVDLGTIGVGTADEPTVVSDERPLPSGGVVWFRFNVPASIDGSAGVRQYFDIDTEDSSIENTVIALFRDDGSGTLVSTDNDDGNLTYSQLTYGRGTRPAVGDGLAYNGRDGAATLTAGTYYLAVTENSASFGSNFIVFFNTGTGTGSVLVNIRSGIQSPVIHGPVTNPANGHKYYLFDVGLSWPQAENFAQSLFDGHLASISDADENEFVRNSVLAHDGTSRRGWIGLNDVDSEGTFVWSDGTPFNFTSWSDGEPNNGGVSGIEEDHIEMFGSNGLWNDVKIDGAGTPGADFAVAEVGGCSADINGTNGVTADDIFAFLDAWFNQFGQTGSGLSADFNRDNAVTADDIFAFLDAWFAQTGVCS